VASFRRRTKKEDKEDAEVDVFYNPANPHRSFVLQALASRKYYWFSPETDAIMCSRFMSTMGWLVKVVEYALWLFVIWLSIDIIMSF